MISILRSNATHPNTLFKEDARPKSEDNLKWLSRHVLESEEISQIVLIGGADIASFRLRVAQSHLRHDMHPSHWSHALLLGPIAQPLAKTSVFEISLQPPGGFGFPPPLNGVQQSRIDQYRSARAYPNIALLRVAAPQAQVAEALNRFRQQRPVLDALELMLRWLAYVWGVAPGGANPLYDGLGIPSAAMLEIVFGAVGIDLTPGLESRASCPEAIWQAAKWWYEFYEQEQNKSLVGAYYVGHELGDA